MVVDRLYQQAIVDKSVDNGFSFDGDVLAAALKRIYDRKYNPRTEIDAELFEEVNRIFDTATDVGFSGHEAGGDFMEQLRTNNAVFAAFKTHRMGRDMAAQLIDENGEVKSFQQFRSDVEPIASHHVDTWLRTEYDTAIKRAHRAAEMRQFMAEADVLPNIRWLESTAVNPRESHMPFYDHVWPVDDPFWEEHKPGDEWGCQCGWEATDDPVTDNTGLGGERIKPSPGLDGNPARTGQIFSDDHPYFPSDCSACAFKGVQLTLFTNRTKDCYHCKNILKAVQKAQRAPVVEEFKRLKADPNYSEVKYDKKSGGLSAVHREHNFDPVVGPFGIRRGEYERRAVDALRKSGHQVRLESERAADGIKTPDGLLNGVTMDIKAVESTGRWTIKNKFAAACAQQARCVVLYFHDRAIYSEERIRNGWELYLNDPARHAQPIEKIVCVVEDTIEDFVP